MSEFVGGAAVCDREISGRPTPIAEGVVKKLGGNAAIQS